MSNLINNDMPPPPDVSQAAAIAADAAKIDPSGDAAFLANKALQEARFRAQEYARQQAYVDEKNAPVLAEMQKKEAEQTSNILTGAVAAVGTLAVAELALSATGGVVGAWNRPAANEPTTSEMGPAKSFNARAMETFVLAGALGRAPPARTMILGEPFIAAGMAGLVADSAAPDPSANDPSESVARIQPRRNTSLMFENNSLASGPKPPVLKDRYGA